jgi:hypothetical protein
MANRYWVGGSTTWDSTSNLNWSTTSGGTGGASVPTSADSVFFDRLGTYTVALGGTVGLNCLDITVSAGIVTFETGGSSPSFTVWGNMSLASGTIWTAINNIGFNGSNAKTITTNGTVLNASVSNDGSGTITLGSALTIGSNKNFNLNAGTLDLNGFTLTTTYFNSTTANTRSIAFGSSNIVIANNTNGTSGGILNITNGGSFTNTGTGRFAAPANLPGTFSCIGIAVLNAPNLTFTGTGTAAQTLSTGSTFGNLDFGTTAFDPGTTSLTLRGLALSAGGTFTNLTPSILGTGGILNGRGNTTLLAITVNVTGTGITTLTGAFSLAPTGAFTLTSGTLDLNGFDLTTGVFNSTGTGTRSIAFGSNNIKLATTTPGQYNLSMAAASGFSWTGTGGFTTTANITRSFRFGTQTSPDSIANAPNLTWTDSGSAVQTILTNSEFGTLDFGSTAFDPGTTNITVKNIVLSSSGSYTNLGIVMATTGSILSRNKSIRSFTINATDTDVITLLDNLNVSGIGAATTTLTNGTLNLNGFTLTTAQFSSNTSQNRSIAFGSSNIIVQSSGTYSANMLDMANLTNFTWTGSGKFVLAMSGNGVRTLAVGTASGATLSNAPNVSFISSTETATLNIEPGSWFNTLDFTNTTNTPTQSNSTFGFSVSTLILSSTGTYTNLIPLFTRTQTWTAQYGKQLGGIGVIDSAAILTLDGTQTYTSTAEVYLEAGTLDLGGYDLTTSVLNSSGQNTRAIAFGSNNIILNNLTAGKVNLAMSTATNFTWSGTGGFRAAANITRTFSFGSAAGGTSTNAPNLTFTGSGTAVQTLTNGGWFNKLDFGTTAFNAGLVGSYVNTIVLSSGGSYTGYTATMVGTGSITSNGAAIGGVTIDVGVGNTCSLSSALNVSGTLLLITGTLALNGYDITTSTLQSTGTTDRAIAFGSNNITLQSATAGSTALSFAQALGFTRTGTGGLRAPATPARVFTFGSTQGGTSANALSLTFTGTGTSNATLTSNSWFNTLDFGTTAFDPGSTLLNVSTLILSSGGTFTGLRPSFTRTQTWTPQFSKQLGGIGVNGSEVTLTLNGTQTYTATSIFTLAEGTLNLGGFDLTVGTFISSFSTTRSIAFGSNNIILATTAVGATNLNMSNATGFTWTGTGGFRAAADITRTFSFAAISGGTSTNAPNLTFTGSGTAVQTLSTGSWFNKLDFGITAFDPGAVAVNVNSITLSTGGTYTSLTLNTIGTGTVISNGKTLNIFTVNCPGGTTTLGDALTIANVALTNVTTLTAGTLNLAGFTLTTGIFSSSVTNTRSIAFASGNIVLNYGGTSIILRMADLTNFTCTGTGGFVYPPNTNVPTFQCGSTTGGSSAGAPNLTLTGASSNSPVFSSGSWFNKLDFGTTVVTPPATTLNLNSLILSSSGGTFSTISINTIGTGTITSNGKAIAALNINSGSGTTTLAGALSCTTYAQTSGTINFATFNLTCSSTATYTAGTLSNTGTISCTTWTCAGEFTMTSGTITPSTSFIVQNNFNYNGGTLSPVATFTHTSGTVTLGKAYALAATGAYTLTAGTLNLNGFNLTTGTFISSNSNTRSIVFGTNNIVLATTSAATNLSMTTATGFTWTGTGGFTTDASVTRTFQFGNTAGGSANNAPNLTFTGSGTAVQTLTTGSWFNNLNYGTTAYTHATSTLNVSNITLSSGGTYTNLSITTANTGTITTNGKTISALTVNHSGTTTLAGAVTIGATGITTLTSGTLNLAGFTLTTGTFSSVNTNTRSIAFGTGSITLAHTTAAQTVLNVPDATGFSYTGTPTFTTTMSVTRTFTFGATAGGSVNNAPNLALTSGASVPTIISGSWFKALNFTGTTSTPAVTIVNVDTLTLATGGTYTNLTPQFTRTQTWTSQFSKQLAGIGVNISGGTLTLDSTQTYAANSICYIIQGILNLGGTNQTFGILDSNTTNSRGIAFGSNSITLNHTITGTTVLNIPDATNFTIAGTGGFTSAMSVNRTFTFGTTGGSAANAPSLSLTSGASTPTITNSSWFKSLDFTGTTSTIPATTISVDTLTLATGGTYTGLTPKFTRTQTWTPQFSKQLGGIGVNNAGAVLTLEPTQTYTSSADLYVDAGTLNLNSTNQTFADFISTRTETRSITGGGSITINNNWTVSNGSGFTGSDYTIYMASQNTKTFAGGGGAYGTLVQQTPSTLNITGSNTFADIRVNSNMAVPAYQQEFTTPGTYSWTAPPGVYSVSAVTIGGSGGTGAASRGSGAGGLGWKNNITVVPGQTYTVVVGAGGLAGGTSAPYFGGTSYFIDVNTVAGYGAGQGGPGGEAGNSFWPGGWTGDGGGVGGYGMAGGYAGGGAGGYSGNGGNGGAGSVAGTGAGGGGGGGGYASTGGSGAAGGGTGIYGQGNNGAGGANVTTAPAGAGGAGSVNLVAGSIGYGGGSGGLNNSGNGGAVRIIWGPGRAFPSTNTIDVNVY